MDENLMKTVPVKVQQKSGFDKSYQNLLTTTVGTLTPLVCEEVIPNTTVNMKVALSAQLPPLATDTFMRCQLKTEAFFVPTRILMRGYEEWLTGNENQVQPGTTSTNRTIVTPVMQVRPQDCKAGSLLDYLGVMNNMTEEQIGLYSATTINISAFPALAYHKIWNDWYRNSLVQQSIYNGFEINTSYNVANSPFVVPTSYVGTSFIPSVSSSTAQGSAIFVDGVSLYDLRQRNFGLDYFTSAQPNAQQGDAQKVSFSTNAATGSFTIAALRAANSMQQFKERNGIAGNRIVDYVKAQYGANLNDAIAQRPVLLGSAAFDVYSKGIYQQSNSQGATTTNPFDSVAAKYGSAYAEGTDFIIKGFTAAEPGYIMVLVSLVPKVTYSSGIRKELFHYTKASSQSDMANPILQNTGNQPIYSNEVNFGNAYGVNADHVFGYTDRYAEYKTRNDELHGLLRDGESLASFALQRSFDGAAQEINTAFLTIPTDYLDQVAAVNGDISKYGVWIDSYIDLKESMPLARYAVPSLQDPAAEHGETVVIDRGGKRLS